MALWPTTSASLRGRSGLLLKVTLQNYYSDAMHGQMSFDGYNPYEVHYLVLDLQAHGM